MATTDLISPGASWNGTAESGGSPPTENPSVIGAGWTGKAICAPDCGNYFWLESADDDYEITVACEHGDDSWIGDVSFWLEGTTVTVSTQTKSARTGVIGFSCVIDKSAIEALGIDGDAHLYVTARPVNGYERLIGPIKLHLNYNGTISRAVVTVKASGGDYTNIHAALQGAASGSIVKVDAGTWLWDEADSGTTRDNARSITVQPADGLSAGDVIISKTTRTSPNTYIRPRSIRTTWRNIHFDMGKISHIYPAYFTDKLPEHNFIGCDFTDTNGVDGGDYGYHSSEYAAYFFRAADGGSAYCDTCTFATTNTSGARLYLNCSGEFSWDCVSFVATTTQPQWIAILCTEFEQTAQHPQRCHASNTVTVGSATYNSGTNRTTIVLADSPTVDTFSDTARFMIVDTSSTVSPGTKFPTVSQSNTTKEIIVTGDASALSPGDLVWTYIIAHADAFQFLGSSSQTSGTYENIIAQRYRATGPYIQPTFWQPGGFAITPKASSSATTVTFASAHGLTTANAGQDYLLARDGDYAGEYRRIVAIPDATTVTIATAFSGDLAAGTTIGRFRFAKDIGVQCCIFDHTGPGVEQTQWQNGHDHMVIRQCSHLGTYATFRNTAGVGFMLANSVIRDSIWQSMSADSGFPSSGIVIDNNHFIEGDERGTNSSGGAVVFDANYVPTGITKTAPSPKILWDYSGVSLANDGSDLVGAMQGQLEPPVSAPTVTTGSVSNVTTTTATVSGNVTSDGGATITQRGFVYGLTTNPVIGGDNVNISVLPGTTGEFSDLLTELEPGTTYHVRAFATNSEGTSYGDNVEFETKPLPTIVLDVNNNPNAVSLGQSSVATATASDADGDLTESITWTSSKDGLVGTGGSLDLSVLSVGAHTITLAATNSGGTTSETYLLAVLDMEGELSQSVYRTDDDLDVEVSLVGAIWDQNGPNEAGSTILSSNKNWLVIAPGGGVLGTPFNLTIKPSLLPVGNTHTAAITVDDTISNGWEFTFTVDIRSGRKTRGLMLIGG